MFGSYPGPPPAKFTPTLLGTALTIHDLILTRLAAAAPNPWSSDPRRGLSPRAGGHYSIRMDAEGAPFTPHGTYHVGI